MKRLMRRVKALAKVGGPMMAVMLVLAGAQPGRVQAQGPASGTVVFRCPGNPPLFTNSLSDAEIKEKGCRPIDSTPITVFRGAPPRVVNTASAGSGTPAPVNAAAPASRPAEARVDPSEQKARDTDSKRILAAELRKEEERLAALQKEFNGGEPERRGDERNYQKYLDRVAELKASIARKETDIASIKREIAKLPQ
jgi:hypothetical protein